MGKLAIIIIFGAIVILFPIINSNLINHNPVIDRFVQNYESRELQNAATSYAAMVIYNISEDSKNGSFNINNFNYTETAIDFENAAITVVTTQDSGSVSSYNVMVTSVLNNITATAEVVSEQIPFSYYGQFFNSWPGNLYYGTGEGVDGPLHINGGLGVGQVPGPVFTGNITLTGSVSYRAGATPENFMGFQGDSLIEGADAIALPNQLDFLDKPGAVQLDDLFEFSDDIDDLYINFDDDGAGVGILELYAVPFDYPDLSIPDSLAKYRKIVRLDSLSSYNNLVYSATMDLHLQGQMTGQLSIASEERMFITDDITYKSDPLQETESTDILGLICNDNIYIETREKPYTSGEYYNEDDTDVYASIFSTQSVKIVGIRTSGISGSWPGPTGRGTFTTIGGRLQEYASATWSGGSNFRGFKEKIIYDKRFRRLRPPGIPFTLERRTSRWRESVNVASNGWDAEEEVIEAVDYSYLN